MRADLLRNQSPMPQATPPPTSAWRTIAPGLEWTTLSPDGDDLAQLIVIRINPQLVQFRAHYSPGAPRGLSEWRAQAATASVIINANFFDEAHRVLGAVVSDGVLSGRAYRNRGGAFLVRGGLASVVANRGRQLNIEAGAEQLIQGFPLLVEGGQSAYFNTSGNQRTRRTLIAEDTAGRILILVSPFLGLSLADLSAYLPGADLAIVTAVNLDGGGSTMIALPEINFAQPSFDPVPAVLAVYRR